MVEVDLNDELLICTSCGASYCPLEEDEETSCCPRCLMRHGLDATSILSEGEDSAPREDPRGRPEVVAPEVIARAVPDYEIQELLGFGGMGAVYKATHRRLHRPVAIKVLLPKLGSDKSFTERFLREARTLAGLNHPAIVTVYDFGVAEGRHFFAMEYIDGLSLRDLIRQDDPLDRDQVLEIISQLCDALHYAHQRGVVHRDIKPDNILIDRAGKTHITDFGLAKILARNLPREPHLTATHQVMGTPHYMAPEQIEHPLDVDHRADLYSLGVVLYELLTKELPLGRFTPPSGKSGTDARLDLLVMKALEKEPGKRFQHAADLKREIVRIRDGSSSSPTLNRIEKALNRGVHMTRKALDDARDLYQRTKMSDRMGRGLRDRALETWRMLERWYVTNGGPWLNRAINRLRHGWRRLAETDAIRNLGDRVCSILQRFWPGRRPKPILVEDESRGVRLHPRFVEEQGLIADTAARVDTVLMDLHRRYAEVEREHSTLQRSPDGTFSVSIQAFPEELNGLRRELRARVFSVADRAVATRLLSVGMLDQVLPYGRRPLLVRVVTEAGTDRAIGMTRSRSGLPLPALYRRHLEAPESVQYDDVEAIQY